MKHNWFEVKEKIIQLRRKGWSMIRIESEFGVPRSTLSGWFKGIKLSEKQIIELENNKVLALKKARVLSAKWHNEQKAIRIKHAEDEASRFLNLVKKDQEKTLLHIAMAFLYLGEGAKTTVGTVLGNSNSEILSFYVNALINEFGVPVEKIKCELHLRADQNSNDIKKYWSKQLSVPVANFTSVSIDPRTKGRPTFPSYKGVCVVRCGSVHIQRYLVALSGLFLKNYKGS